jgi:biopolymer transport protein ExbD
MKFYVPSRKKPTIVIVALIDIMTVLLIFFAVATTFKKSHPVLKIELPEAGSGEKTSSQQPLLISITPPPAEKVFLNGVEVPLSQLETRLREERKQNSVVSIALQSDRKASFGLVVKVMDVARKAGFEQLPAFIEQEKTGAP